MPRESSSISLFDALSETGYQASVISTYCCYFPFYEEVVLRRLIDRGCTNNILLVDARLCAEAFASEETRPRRAGRDYTLIPVEVGGAFHPKLVVTVGKSKGAVFVGSHNATMSGFGLNDEVTNAFLISGSGVRQNGQVVRTALDYLQAFVPTSLTGVVDVFSALRRSAPWLEGPVAASSDERLLLTTPGDGPDLWSRILPLVPKRPTSAFVCGPFFDSKLTFLTRVVEDLKLREVVVGIDPDSVEIDAAAARKFREAKFVDVRGIPRVSNRRDTDKRYLHAKILWFAGAGGELLVTGSANPSAPAFLATSKTRNAEGVVVDRRKGSAAALGLAELMKAPPLQASDWKKVQQRQEERADVTAATSSTLFLAVPADDGFVLDKPCRPGAVLEAFGVDGKHLGPALVRDAEPSRVDASPALRDEAQTLRGLDGTKRLIIALVHRPEEIARNVGTDRQRELRKALGALEEDPGQLDALLKLTEKVIFDSEDVVVPEPTQRKVSTTNLATVETGPESLAVDAAGRSASRRKRRLASGDILVLLDALMQRLGVGLTAAPGSGPKGEEVRPATEDDLGDDDPVPSAPPEYDVLADACRGKVGRLVRRMVKQLGLAGPGSARRAVVQLSAVLSVIHTLRIMEQRTEWRSKHLKLVDQDDQWELLEAAAFAVSWNTESLGPRAVQEANGEVFQELSMVRGLLAWLAWETEVDVASALARSSPIDLEEDDDPWSSAQVFASVAAGLADDSDAQAVLTEAVGRTGRRGLDGGRWVAAHLPLARALADAAAAPESVRPVGRKPRAGDLVVLGSAFDPRVRVVLRVVPSGASDKIAVFDRDREEAERQFVASYVVCTPWVQAAGSSRLTGTK